MGSLIIQCKINDNLLIVIKMESVGKYLINAKMSVRMSRHKHEKEILYYSGLEIVFAALLESETFWMKLDGVG